MLSFWEKNSFIHYSHIIIGAGISGLSLACELAEKNKSARILVLERGMLPTGASTKNAGFACFGSLSENCSDLNLMGENALLQLIEDRYTGLQLLRKRLGDEAIGFQQLGGHELVFKNQEQGFLEQLDSMNSLLFPLFKENLFGLNQKVAIENGLNGSQLSAVVSNSLEGQIDTGKMMDSLWKYASQLGIRILTGAEVKEINESETAVTVELTKHKFSADKLFICTNAFSKSLLPNLDLNPGRGQVIATSVIPNLKVKGTFFFDQGYFYFRNFQNRIIFGGGRNLDFTTEETTAFGSNRTILNTLESYLKEFILPQTNYSIEHTWSGIMAFGNNKQPLVQALSKRQFIGIRLNGMGVALGSKIAKDLVKLAEE
ncbi:MAG: FAD-binding oxidoreductase [Bacteroidia bacterium]|nr:FAD-binding oxidoreductase [Bacteroidia bacterium]MCF8425819.1 FAD-binding oxidoreductase [Bacteroidia bacterium]MCF8447689.1 FAD-binding oxidoreductase [Bacteroidia bacterium]